MGVDLSPAVDQSDFHGTLRSWIKCARCSERLGRPYAVEVMGSEGFEESGTLHRRYRWIVSVECHGEKMNVSVDCPVYWTRGMRQQALAYIYAFVKKGPGLYTAEVRRGTRGQAAGILTGEVR